MSNYRLTTNDSSLNQTIYNALSNDLIHKKHVDMVFSYFNEITATVVFTTRCHRIALAAKSRYLHQILLHNADQEIDSTNLVIVGEGSKADAKAIFNQMYNPATSSEEVLPWENTERKDCTLNKNLGYNFLDEGLKEED